MIVFSQNNDGVKSFTTNGCGCCSCNYDLPEEKENIIDELRENVTALKEACDLLEIDILEFIDETLR